MKGLSISPKELSADRAEGGLVEEGGYELVILDDMNLGLLDSSSPPVEGHNTILGNRPNGWVRCHCGGTKTLIHTTAAIKFIVILSRSLKLNY